MEKLLSSEVGIRIAFPHSISHLISRLKSHSNSRFISRSFESGPPRKLLKCRRYCPRYYGKSRVGSAAPLVPVILSL